MESDKNWDWEDIVHLENAAYSAGVLAGESHNTDTDSSSPDDR